MQLTYLQTLLSLPWGVYTQDVIDIPNAKKILDKEHYGLEKVKERILEHLAVLKLKGEPEVADHLPLRSSGSRKDFFGTFHRHGSETEIRTYVTGWRAR